MQLRKAKQSEIRFYLNGFCSRIIAHFPPKHVRGLIRGGRRRAAENAITRGEESEFRFQQNAMRSGKNAAADPESCARFGAIRCAQKTTRKTQGDAAIESTKNAPLACGAFFYN